MNPKVSVIIATYGRSEYIINSLESAINQSYNNIEIIIVDDNGLNSAAQIETQKKLQSYIEQGKIIYFANPNNSGASASRNQGATIATGQYITFLDDDDLYKEEKVELQVKALESNKSDINLCSAEIITDKGFTQKINTIKLKQENINSAAKFITQGISYTPMIMISKKSFFAAGQFPTDIKMQEDKILILRALKSGATISSLSEELYQYRIHGNQLTDRSFGTDHLDYIEALESHFNNQLTRKERHKRNSYFALDRISIKYKERKDVSFQVLLQLISSTIPTLQLKSLAKGIVRFIQIKVR